ncbi:MAG: metal ABC transporter permease [Clostridiales bacterium]|nr:metal ABC transporter permease [Clostridiales bacterium]
MINALFHYQFMQNALIGALLASILTGIIGAIIVEKKWIMLSSGIAHSSFGGIGLGYMLNFEPIYGAFLFAIFSSILIPTIDRKTDTGSENLTAMLWSLGMALGIFFIAFTPGYPPDMTSYLFGNILTISFQNIMVMIVVTAIVLTILLSYYNHWKAYLFDHEFAFIIGINTSVMDYVLYFLIAISVVALIKMVGIILIIALLTIPPSIARFYAKSFSRLIIYSMILGFIFSFIGLFISYYYNIPSGATIILVSIIAFVISIFIKKNNQ